ncbi:tRNA (adenosine(37)-N6)-threonylcarbamoyltransferase complex dimerization subunit type 1 TsaB [Salimicrobium halophilum]|uniref:tRNA threonylcarbamoyladenosine biosynthesis protein TsaB n=1 Tax=Salimicrobium halophilum TaxID=86666 RepID=A0A1G8WKJ5_9BACI|nr:tRNA (adenosine(37)-N6)-threonylcarbamoyltransferase complex dimerization subunit type 1 TsaB [Salimicrobium halophilum]SDJ78185.1 tRNA threonylcarbamoyladenosine biosynthesis protein TsaB [Salimicrobium halophilum]
MNILAIDTSNYILGVAVIKNHEVAGEWMTNVKKNHSVRLMPAIDQMMRETETSPEELDQIAVAHGPGSFTGVRIGMATAKSMAFALQIPVVGISSLEVLARQGTFFDGLICPFFDARRGRVYTGLYDGEMNVVMEEENIDMDTWLEKLKAMHQSILFVSQDISEFRGRIEEKMGDRAVFPTPAHQYARPSYLALSAMKKPASSTHTLSPNYLRLPEAEQKWLNRQEK